MSLLQITRGWQQSVRTTVYFRPRPVTGPAFLDLILVGELERLPLQSGEGEPDFEATPAGGVNKRFHSTATHRNRLLKVILSFHRAAATARTKV